MADKMKLTKTQLREIIREGLQKEWSLFKGFEPNLAKVYLFLDKQYQKKGKKRIDVKKMVKKIGWKFGLLDKEAKNIMTHYHKNYTSSLGY